MSLSAFRILQPRSVDEACRMLDQHGADAMIIAGGTDVIPNLQMKLFTPRVLLDIKPLRELAQVEFSSREGLRIGATASLTHVLETSWLAEKFPVLASAISTIAGPLQRNMGTIGGNLCLETRCRWYNQSHMWRTALGGCLKKDGEVCHVAPGGKFCWAAWSGDSAPALLALDAEIPRLGIRLPNVRFDAVDAGSGLESKVGERVALEELRGRVHIAVR